MAMYKMRNPDRFGIAFHMAFNSALKRFEADKGLMFLEEDVNLALTEHEAEAKGKSLWKLVDIERKRIGAFKYMIQQHPNHHLNRLTDMAEIRAYPKTFKEGWGLRLTFRKEDKMLDAALRGLLNSSV